MESKQQALVKSTNNWFLIGLASLLIIIVGLGIPYLFLHFNIRHALPIVIGILLTYITLVSRDPLRLYLYLFVFILPIYIVFYLVILPLDLPEHPGLINFPAIYSHDIPFWMLVVFLVLNIAMHRQEKIIFPKLLIPLAIYLIPAAISTIGARIPSLGYYELMRTAKMIAITMVLVNVITRKKHLWICLVIIFISIILQNFIAILQYIFPTQAVELMEKIGIYPNLINTVPDDPDSASRICGTTGYCNSLAGYLELTLPIFISLLLFAPIKTWIRILIAGMLLITAPIFYLTYSRGGLLGMAIILTIFGGVIVSKLAKRLKNFSLVMALIFAYLLSLGIAIYAVSSSRSEETGGILTDSVRVGLTNTAITMIKDKPLFGVGLNNFPENLLVYDTSGIEYVLLYPVHNTYLLAASETGIIGAIFLLWFFFNSLKTAYGAIRVKDPKLKAIGLGILAGFIGWLVHNFVAPLYQNWLVNRLTFMFLIAVVFVLPKLVKAEVIEGKPVPQTMPDEFGKLPQKT